MTSNSIAPAVTRADRPEIVTIQGVSKRFVVRKDKSIKERIVTLGRAGRAHREDFWALRDVTLDIPAGQTIALIGHNGSGKSTLLKVIGGIIDPSSGSVARRGRIAALLELGAGFHPDLTGRENVFLNGAILGLSRSETEARLDDILAFAGIGPFIDTQVKFYSSGMYVRLAFAVAVHTDPDLLLVDEVLAVGDEAFQRKCLDKILDFQKEGRTIVLVTHDLGQVTRLADRAVLLNEGQVVVDGEPHEAVAAFRNLLEGRRAHDEGDSAAARRVLDARVVRATATAVGRAEGDPVQPGDDLLIAVEVEHKSGIDDWSCAIEVESSMGMTVYATSTKDLGARLEPLRERRRLEFLIKDVRLGEGKYFVGASLYDLSGHLLFDLRQATSFDAPAQPASSGVLYADITVAD